MKTAEERFNELTLMSDTIHKGDVVNIMHEYALEVAEKALKDAAEDAGVKRTQELPHDQRCMYNSRSECYYSVNKETVLKTKIITP